MYSTGISSAGCISEVGGFNLLSHVTHPISDSVNSPVMSRVTQPGELNKFIQYRLHKSNFHNIVTVFLPTVGCAIQNISNI